jgi:hypothetical protein
MGLINLDQNTDSCWNLVKKVTKLFFPKIQGVFFLGYEIFSRENTKLLRGVRRSVSQLVT